MIVFLAGPYRSENGSDGIYENLYKARFALKNLWKAGYPTVCPNLDCAYTDGFITDFEVFEKGTCEILQKCDMAIFLPGYETSTGCKKEMKVCETLNIPTIFLKEENANFTKHFNQELVKRMIDNLQSCLLPVNSTRSSITVTLGAQ